MPDSGLLLSCVAAVLVGFSKTGMPGMGFIVVPLLAMAVGDARLSVGVLLPLLMVGDLWALGFYNRHADWRIIVSIAPWIIVGLCVGGFLLQRIDNTVFPPVLGGLVLCGVLLELARQRFRWEHLPRHPLFAGAMGTAAGIATILGNLAGAFTNLYLLSRGLDKERFIGSVAWMFFLVNASKFPVYLRQDMITPETLVLDLKLAPAVCLGALIGRLVLPRVSTALFYRLVMVLATVGALRLMFL
jgi:hypothetical protein